MLKSKVSMLFAAAMMAVSLSANAANEDVKVLELGSKFEVTVKYADDYYLVVNYVMNGVSESFDTKSEEENFIKNCKSVNKWKVGSKYEMQKRTVEKKGIKFEQLVAPEEVSDGNACSALSFARVQGGEEVN